MSHLDPPSNPGFAQAPAASALEALKSKLALYLAAAVLLGGGGGSALTLGLSPDIELAKEQAIREAVDRAHAAAQEDVRKIENRLDRIDDKLDKLLARP